MKPVINLENSVGRKKDVQVIDLDSVMKKCEVIAMEGGYVENAGAVFYHLIGNEHFFHNAIRIRKLCRLSRAN